MDFYLGRRKSKKENTEQEKVKKEKGEGRRTGGGEGGGDKELFRRPLCAIDYVYSLSMQWGNY